jgi:hypothetical protein
VYEQPACGAMNRRPRFDAARGVLPGRRAPSLSPVAQPATSLATSASRATSPGHCVSAEGGADACSILANTDRPVRSTRAGGATIAFLESDRRDLPAADHRNGDLALVRSAAGVSADLRFARSTAVNRTLAINVKRSSAASHPGEDALRVAAGRRERVLHAEVRACGGAPGCLQGHVDLGRELAARAVWPALAGIDLGNLAPGGRRALSRRRGSRVRCTLAAHCETLTALTQILVAEPKEFLLRRGYDVDCWTSPRAEPLRAGRGGGDFCVCVMRQ